MSSNTPPSPLPVPSNDILSSLNEKRLFPPPSEFSSNAHVKSMADYDRLYEEADRDPETFWANIARELHWFEPWKQVLEWDVPWAKWFAGGKINVSYNCLDRHCATWRKNKAAIIWEGEPGETRTLTYQQLLSEVSRCANVLKSLGVKKGDRVAIYMGMCPELAIALLACARIGAPHSVIFGGFSSNALVDRINDAQCVAVITQDGSFRRGVEVKLKPAVDEALQQCPSVTRVLVYKRTGSVQQMVPGRDHWWHELMATQSDECPAEQLDSEDPLYLLYTSGTTGKPKGILHTTGGYSVSTYITTKWVFDIKDDDIYWCTADIGWVTGHSYVVYGPLQNGATVFMYEGGPTHPQPDRFWEMIDRHKVTIFYTAPTAIRAFYAAWGTMDRESPDEVAAFAWQRGRTDQSGSLDVVPQFHRPGPLPHCGHLVADRDRCNHDQSHARRHAHEARFLHAAAAGNQAGNRHQGRRARTRWRGRLFDREKAVAFHVAQYLRGPGAVPIAILVAGAWCVLYRRWRPDG